MSNKWVGPSWVVPTRNNSRTKNYYNTYTFLLSEWMSRWWRVSEKWAVVTAILYSCFLNCLFWITWPHPPQKIINEANLHPESHYYMQEKENFLVRRPMNCNLSCADRLMWLWVLGDMVKSWPTFYYSPPLNHTISSYQLIIKIKTGKFWPVPPLLYYSTLQLEDKREIYLLHQVGVYMYIFWNHYSII